MKNPLGPLLCLAALLPAVLRADHEDFVVINATAAKPYTERKFAGGAPKPESYVLYQGRYFGGATRDASIDHAHFMAIAKTLAPDLARQNYLPTRDAQSANLLIVVNWGTTVTDPLADKNDPQNQFQLRDLYSSINNFNTRLSAGGAGALGGLSDMNANIALADTQELAQESEMARNSRLLGYQNALAKEGKMAWATPSGVSAEEASHLEDLLDERYFVILLAYDYQQLRAENRPAGGKQLASDVHRPKPPAPHPVWAVRMNVRAAGNNFTEALPAMSAAASDYFGKQMDDLITRQTSVGAHSHVEVGAPQVIKYGDR